MVQDSWWLTHVEAWRAVPVCLVWCIWSECNWRAIDRKGLSLTNLKFLFLKTFSEWASQSLTLSMHPWIGFLDSLCLWCWYKGFDIFCLCFFLHYLFIYFNTGILLITFFSSISMKFNYIKINFFFLKKRGLRFKLQTYHEMKFLLSCETGNFILLTLKIIVKYPLNTPSITFVLSRGNTAIPRWPDELSSLISYHNNPAWWDKWLVSYTRNR